MEESGTPDPWPEMTPAMVDTHWSLAMRFLGDFVRSAPANVVAGLTMQYPDLGAALGHARIVQEAQEKGEGELSAVSRQLSAGSGEAEGELSAVSDQPSAEGGQ